MLLVLPTVSLSPVTQGSGPRSSCAVLLDPGLGTLPANEPTASPAFWIPQPPRRDVVCFLKTVVDVYQITTRSAPTTAQPAPARKTATLNPPSDPRASCFRNLPHRSRGAQLRTGGLPGLRAVGLERRDRGPPHPLGPLDKASADFARQLACPSSRSRPKTLPPLPAERVVGLGKALPAGTPHPWLARAGSLHMPWRSTSSASSSPRPRRRRPRSRASPSRRRRSC